MLTGPWALDQMLALASTAAPLSPVPVLQPLCYPKLLGEVSSSILCALILKQSSLAWGGSVNESQRGPV